jgi:hypothetical protein
MKAMLQRTIELLKRRVKENLDTINHNQAEIRQLLNQPLSAERTYYIEKHYDINKSLMTENNDFINLQLTLMNFLDKYKDVPGMDERDDIDIPMDLPEDDEILFELTVNGQLLFDMHHPKFGDEAFFSKLLQFYSTMEAYEKCSALLNQKKIAG